MNIAARPNTRTLSESASKALLARHHVAFAPERMVGTPEDAANAAREIGFPVVVKLNGDAIAHKTERGLVRLNLRDASSVALAAEELLAAAKPSDGDVTLLVAAQIRGTRELIAGVVRTDDFGAVVMVGIGGVAAEAFGDVSFRLAPISLVDAHEMLDELLAQRLLGAFRGEPALDRHAMAQLLVGLSHVVSCEPNVVSIDVNPLIVCDGMPVAVDALVEVHTEAQA